MSEKLPILVVLGPKPLVKVTVRVKSNDELEKLVSDWKRRFGVISNIDADRLVKERGKDTYVCTLHVLVHRNAGERRVAHLKTWLKRQVQPAA